MPGSRTPSTARRELLTLLLEAHERSNQWGRPGPWRRDVVLKLNEETFPEAFGPDGRERLAALKAAAEDLGTEGALRLVRHRGYASEEIRELRLGRGEVEKAHAQAVREGFEPLSVGLAAIASRAEALRHGGGLPAWLMTWLEALLSLPSTGETERLGCKRMAFKGSWHELDQALVAVAALARGVEGWERVISERVFGDSKRLATLRALVATLLVLADPQWEGIEPDSPMEVLEQYGVRRKPGLFRCAGTARLEVNGRQYRLEDFVPVAHIPEAWASAWVLGVNQAGVKLVTTIENEYPFIAYVEEAGGPAALGARGELAVYTAGFPAPYLLEALQELARSGAGIRHWGDADVGGLRIWWRIRSAVGVPVPLFRTTAGWVQQESARGSTRLTLTERQALRKLLVQLEQHPARADADLVQAREVAEALVRLGAKLEQERFEAG